MNCSFGNRVTRPSPFVVIGINALLPVVQRNPWSKFLARREMDSEDICSSYTALRLAVIDAVRPDIHSFFDNTFAVYPVERDTLLEESKELCRAIATKLRQITDERLYSCPSAACLMHIYSGVCTDEGTLTHFFYSVFTGYQSVNLVQDRCAFILFPPFGDHCARSRDLNVTIPEGPAMYKRSILKRSKCLIGTLEKYPGKLKGCGDLGSLKSMAIIIEMFITAGPGVVFTTDEIYMKKK